MQRTRQGLKKRPAGATTKLDPAHWRLLAFKEIEDREKNILWREDFWIFRAGPRLLLLPRGDERRETFLRSCFIRTAFALCKKGEPYWAHSEKIYYSRIIKRVVLHVTFADIFIFYFCFMEFSKVLFLTLGSQLSKDLKNYREEMV